MTSIKPELGSDCVTVEVEAEEFHYVNLRIVYERVYDGKPKGCHDSYLTPDEARDLAFCLLSYAEYVEQRYEAWLNEDEDEEDDDDEE